MAVATALKVFSKYTGHIPRHTPVGLAVSGGCDSLALTILATKLFDNVNAFIVDHKLRAGSTEEAERASDLVRSLGGHPHTLTLDWTALGGPPPPSKLQLQARELRYSVLLEKCQAMGLSTLMVGHHKGDQDETFLHRFAMGSGIDGLGGMATQTTWSGYSDVKLLRPLLTLDKSDLVEVCRSEGVEWVEDPTNKSTIYARNHYRRVLAEDPDLVRCVRQLTELSSETRTLLAEQVCSHVTALAKLDSVNGFAVFNIRHMMSVPRPIAKRSLLTLVRFVSGLHNYKFRYGALERHYQNALKYNGKPVSMGRALIAPVRSNSPDDVGIFRAVYRSELKDDLMTIRPGQSVLWQNRWRVELTGEDGEYIIKPLSRRNDDMLVVHGIRRVRSRLLPPELARPGFPTITDTSGNILLIPHYKYVARNAPDIKASVKFVPKISDLEDIVNVYSDSG